MIAVSLWETTNFAELLFHLYFQSFLCVCVYFYFFSTNHLLD